jgi:thioredoxin 1
MTQITDEQFDQEVLQSQTPVIVDFYADWCGPCRAAAPVLERIAAQFEGKVKVVKVNVDEPKASTRAAGYGVRGIPNFTLFKNGVKVKEIVGFSPTLEEDLTTAANASINPE